MKTRFFLVMWTSFFCVNTAYTQMTVKDSDMNVLMEVADEGDFGSLYINNGSTAPSVTKHKIYNYNGTLYWDGDALATAGSSDGDWSISGNDQYSSVSGNVGIGTASPEFKLSVDTDGGILAKGTYGSGTVLSTSGSGQRMIWYPHKAAFRVGNVDDTQWDDANIGNYSMAMGHSTKASGASATALGYYTTASDDYATAMGHATTASSLYATAMGSNTIASGTNSTAIGTNTTASGAYSTSMGSHTTAASYFSTAIGRYNVGNGSATSWVATDPIFEIGIGTGAGSKTNAVTVLKNGNVGVGTTSPDATLEVSGSAILGSSGVKISEIREITGTTDVTLDYKIIPYPDDYSIDNTRVLSCEINSASNWFSMGYYISSQDNSISYALTETSIFLMYQDAPEWKEKDFRMIVMKVE